MAEKKAGIECKFLPLEIKKLTEEGTFEGYANVTEYRDKGGDIVSRGAFDRTVKANKGKFPLLAFHDPTRDIGLVEVEVDNRGLKVTRGVFNLATQEGREAYAKALLYQANKMAPHMSIGYQAIKWIWEDEGKTRRLQELKLHEVSILPPGYAMNDKARARFVKVNHEWTGDVPEENSEKDATHCDEEEGLTSTGNIATMPMEELKALAEKISNHLEQLANSSPDDSQPKHSSEEKTGEDGDPLPEHSSELESALDRVLDGIRKLTAKE